MNTVFPALARPFFLRHRASCAPTFLVLLAVLFMPGFAAGQDLPAKPTSWVVVEAADASTSIAFRADAPARAEDPAFRIRTRVKTPLGAWIPSDGGFATDGGSIEIPASCIGIGLAEGCREILVAGLPSGTTFEFQFAGWNSFGTGPWTGILEQNTTGTKATAPTSAPTGLAAVSGPDAGAITLTWSAPIGDTTEYRVRWRLTDADGGGSGTAEGEWQGWISDSTDADNPASLFRVIGDSLGGITAAAGDASTSFTLTGLNPGVEYEAQVAGVNEASIGDWSGDATTLSGASADATLSALTAGGDAIALAEGTFIYPVTVASSTTSITVTPTLNDSTAASVTVGGVAVDDNMPSAAQTLAAGDTDILIVVTAADSTTTLTYTLRVTRLSAATATLSALSLSAGSISETFAADVFLYTAAIPYVTDGVSVTATATDADAIVVISSETFADDVAQLNFGDNVITVTVTSADGMVMQDYVITATRTAPDISAVVFGGAEYLSPGSFAADVGCAPGCGGGGYELRVASDVENVTVTATFASSVNIAATINKVGDSTAAETLSTMVESASLPVDLGDNILQLAYTQDTVATTYTTTYTFNAIRAADSDATLSALRVGDVEVAIAAGVFTYSLAVPFSLAEAEITAIAADAAAAISGDVGTQTLTFGDNDFTFTITAADGVAAQEYTLRISRLPDISLALTGAALTETFAAATLTHAATAAPDAVNFTATAALSATATATIGVRGDTAADLTSTASDPVFLDVGENIVDIIYTDGGETATYTLIVVRAGPVPPSAPRNVSLTRAAGELIAAWELPQSDGGDAISSYQIRWKYADVDAYLAPVVASPADVAAMTFSIGGLQNGARYDVQVAAENSTGVGAYSAKASAIPFSAPGAPQQLIAVPGKLRLNVSWRAADSRGEAITAQTLEWKLGSETAFTNSRALGANATSAVINELTEAEYDVRLRATNFAGDGDFSATAQATPAAGTPPSAPIFSTKSGSNHVITPAAESLAVVWGAPDDDGGGITSYILRYKQSAQDETAYSTPEAAADLSHRHTISGLTDGTEYDVQIAAGNAVGLSGYVTVENVIPGASAVPTLPRNVTVTPDVASLLVKWERPVSHLASQISNYVVRWKESAAQSYATTTDFIIISQINFQDALTDFRITGLAIGTEYDVQVRASGMTGTDRGKYIPAIQATPILPTTPPTAPQNLTLTVGDASLIAVWSLPASGDVDLLRYKIRSKTAAAANYGAPVDVAAGVLTYQIALARGETYNVQVAAENSAGIGAYSAAAEGEIPAMQMVPGVPILVFVNNSPPVLSQSGGFEVNWRAPEDDGGAPINGYQIRWKESATADYSAAVEITATNYTITGLTDGTKYDLQIAAVNALGVGAHLTADRVTPGATAQPSEPRNVRITEAGEKLLVEWEPPAQLIAIGSATPNAYVVRWKLDTATTYEPEAIRRNVGSLLSVDHTITGLTNDEVYDVQVASREGSGTGDSDFTPAIQATPTAPTAPPSAPQNLRVTRGVASLDAAWDLPQDGALDVSGYKVRWKTLAADDYGAANSADSTARNYTITGLTAGTTYEVQVAAANTFVTGEGEYSAAVAGAAATVPGMVRAGGDGVTALARGLQILWQPPFDNGGSAITGYNVRWKLSADTEYGAGVKTGVNYTITGLTNGEQYDVQVAAENAVGAGENFTFERIVPGASTPPSEPRNVTVTALNKSLAVAWDQTYVTTDSTGAHGVTHFIVRWKLASDAEYGASQNTGGFSGLTSTILGLTNGETYDVQVSAVSNLGKSAYSPPAQAAPAASSNIPSAPRNFTTGVTGKDFAELTWRDPSRSGGGAVSGYALRWKLDSATTFATADRQTLAATARTARIDDLTTGAQYDIEIAAFSDRGEGDAATLQATLVASSDATLAAFSVSPGILQPPFAPETRAYTSAVANTVARVVFRVAFNHPAATATINGADIADGGTAAQMITTDSTEVVIVVTAEDGAAAATYTLTITRLGDFTLDIDGDGTAAAADGIAVARYLAGIRGAALTAGLSGFTTTAAATLTTLDANRDELDVDGDGAATIADGILIARYLLGVTEGAGLTAGHANADDEDTIRANITRLMPQSGQ